MKKISKIIASCILLLLYTNKYKAQMAGTYNVPGTYTSIGSAINDLNIFGVTGAVTINVAAGHTETAPVGGYTLNSIVGASSTNQITFMKSGVGANPLITAYVGTATPSSAQQDGVWRFVGSDYITIDGINITDPNTTNPATMEFGYGFFKIGVTDGCQNNTIKNCVITLNRVNNAAGSGPAIAGSRGIDVVNATSSAHTTALTITSALGTNSNNKFYSNTIQNCNTGIALIGFAAGSPFTFADTGNDVGGNSVSTGNAILNFGGGGTNDMSGIQTLAQYNLNVAYNTLNNNNGSGVLSAQVVRGIYINTATSANASIVNNTISLQGSGTTQLMQGILNTSGSTAASNSINISNNSIVNCTYTVSSTSAVFNAILNSGTPATLTINNNLINNILLQSTGTQIIIETGSPALAAMNSNTITNIFNASATSGILRILKTTSPANLTVGNNLIDGISYTNVASSGAIDGFYGLSSAINVNVLNNVFRNFSTPNAGTINGIREFGVAGNKIIQNNQVYNFFTTAGGAGGATMNGIFCSTGTINISANSVYSLMSTGTTGGTGGTIMGIQISGGTIADIYKNKIHDLSTNSTAPTLNGIFINGATTNNIYNNLIGSISSPTASGTNIINGINYSFGTTLNAYYNTIYLSGTSIGANFGSSALFASTAYNLNMRNNILVNKTTPKGTGLAVAFRRSSTTLTTYLGTSNNNLFYAGVPTASNLILFDGTNSYQTLAAFQTLVGTRDALSVTEDPNFVSIVGSNANFLNINTSIATLIEAGASSISGISDDYSGSVRNATSPDIGAWEGNFQNMNMACAGTPIAGTAAITATTGCPNTLFGLSVSGQSPANAPGIAYQWQSSSSATGPWANISGAVGSSYQTTVSATTYYQFVATCTVSGFSATTAVISYSVSGDACSCTSYITPANNCTFDYISNVTFGNINRNSTCDVLTLYTAPNPTVTAGQSYPISVSTGGDTEGVMAWIDYNGNGILDNATETVLGPLYAGINPATYTALVTIPVTASTGQTRLRVRCNYGSAVSSATATQSFGEIEDYCINILPPVSCSGTPNSGTAGISASSGCANQAVTLSGTGLSSGVGISYQWQSSTTFAGTYTSIPGATLATLPYTVNANSFYRVITTCSASAQSATSSAIGYTANTCVASLTLTDTYGDGWNGGTMNLVVNGVTTTIGSGFTTGTSQIYSACIPALANYSLIFNAVGSYPEEMGITASIGGSIVYNVTGPALQTATTGSLLVNGIACPNCSSANGGTISAASLSMCTSNTVSLNTSGSTGGGGITYAWQSSPTSGGTFTSVTAGTGTNTTTYSTPTLAPGTYFYRLLTTCNGSINATSNEATLTVSGLSNPSISSTSSVVCIGNSATLSASGANTYTWSNGATGNSIVITPTSSAYYFVTGGSAPCANATTSNIPIYYSLNPTVLATSATTVVCAGIPATLTASGANTYSWTDGSTTLGGANINPTPTTATTYTITGYKVNGCNAVTTQSIAVNAAPNVNISGSSGICSGQTATLVASGASTYSWNTTSTSATITSTPVTNTTYTVTGTDALGCKTTTTQLVTVAASLSISITGPSTICIGQTPTLTAGGGVTYTWGATAGNATTSIISPATPVQTTYSVIGASGTCSNTAVFTVSVNALPTVSITGGSALCVGQTTTLTASGAATYTWSSLAVTGSTLSVSPPAPGATYTVTGTSSVGCTDTETFSVISNTLPIISITASSQSVCVNSQVSFTASGANTYTWLGGPNSANYATTQTAATVYTVGGTNLANCISSNTIAVGSFSLPIVSITPVSASVCNGSTGSFTANGASTYMWNTAISGNTFSNVVSSTVVHTVVGTTTAGCSSSQTVGVTSLSLPIVVITPPSITVCANSFINVAASGANTYTWDGGSQNPSTSFFHSSSSTHTVSATDINGCKNTETVGVLANPLPTISASPSFTTACAFSVVNFTASGADTYTWNSTTNGTVVALITPTANSSYTLVGTNSVGCVSSVLIPIIVNALPVLTVSPNTPTICSLSPVNFTASGANTYTWNNTLTSSNFSANPTSTSTYSVSGTNTVTGCVGTKTVMVNVNALPTLSITPSSPSVCVGFDATLTVSGASTYTWNNGTNATNLTVTPNGSSTYSVLGIDANGCQSTKSFTMSNFPVANVVITPSNQVVCLGEVATYSASGATTYTWLPENISNPVFTVSPASTSFYNLNTTDANNCKNTITFVLTIDKCTGINEKALTSNAISIYPNPSNGLINIDFGFEGNKNIVIMNSIGTLINNLTTSNQTETIDLSHLAKGVYFIKVSSKISSGNYKVIVE